MVSAEMRPRSASRCHEHKTAALSAEHITQRAAAGTDARAVETLDLFSGWLGAVAGDLALTLGAKGGIYLAGGIAGRLGPLFNKILFRQRFEAKGRFESLCDVFGGERCCLVLIGPGRCAVDDRKRSIKRCDARTR